MTLTATQAGSAASKQRSRAEIAVLVPCRNEEHSEASVNDGFRTALPSATIYVYDNNSTDDTVARAVAAGACVRHERRQGKGEVVRRMFADVDADIYVIVDGDGTYDPTAAPAMVDRLLDECLDMVVARRVSADTDGPAFRRGHAMGNRWFSYVLRKLFGGEFTDVFSGYRMLSRRFVKSFPASSVGFEIETEITAHAVEIGAACAEVAAPYRARHEASESKLRTYRDGFRILRKSMRIFKELRPLRFFTMLAGALTAVALLLGARVFYDYFETGLVPRFPTAIAAAAIAIVAVVCLTAGIILDTVGRARREVRRLAYLAIPPISARG